MAADLAREIISQSQLRCRPSPLALVVYSRSLSGRILRNENETMRITAPIDRGQLILRVSFPVPNYAPAIGRNIQHQNDDDNQLQRTMLEYNAREDLEGAASCVVGYMSYRDQRDVMMFSVMANGDLGPFPLARWSLDESSCPESGHTAYRLQIVQQILRALLVR